MHFKKNLLPALALLMGFSTHAQQKQASMPVNSLSAFNVQWNEPGPTAAQSMPTGNGDIGLNVWTAANGDLCFFIGKTDAWGAAAPDEKNNWVKEGGVLMKLGMVRVAVSPSPLATGAAFSQVLRLHESEVLVKEGHLQMRVWVDANHPVIRVETESPTPVTVTATLHNWRFQNGDTLVPEKTDAITWYHANPATANEHLQGIVFGAGMAGKGMLRKNDTTLATTAAVKSQLLSVYPLTVTHADKSKWLSALQQQQRTIDALPLAQTRAAHLRWWNQFWDRSWIFLEGDSLARKVNEGYVLQRYVTACAGRGAYPIKFNGSIFVVDNPDYKPNRAAPARAIDADFREWGGQYWFQNTRPMYWPRLAAGDFDMMLPLFKMYAGILPHNAAQVKQYYHHDGAYFAETAPFWGGLLYMGPEVPENWTGHYFTPILELSMMMLDYYDYTRDAQFAKNTLLPVAGAGMTFFDQHFSRDAQGKLLLDPDNSIEMFWKVHNPAPDIAGLHAVVTRLLALPSSLTSPASRAQWERLLGELPPLPQGEKQGKSVLLPYTGPQTAKGHNLENPELYAVYPFRLYGLGKPDLEVAVNTFNARAFRDKGCWVQDPIQAAMLGMTQVAKTYTAYNLTRREPALKFPAFWATGHDYAPDEDNGGNGEQGLQQMLLQTDGNRIYLLPAWPREWNASFKLHAPQNTTVQGRVENGKVVDLRVTPESRRQDVISGL
ncbi:hypothetical protein DCC81_20310 [Chitinophaga parva]|uniref:Uncharacterized protein n=1 Tax=Chitinophaga parva TaxID=2169414 RepID=A0A2T7BCE5_9BACT|nr:DUF5703 domain-containing protein [Chitinophaga parva]PUZ22773.1 hypothetical protein DCC81_20310 [Chitinophaga parva]